MKWQKNETGYTLEGTKLSIEFAKVSSKLYAKLYFEGKLMCTFSNPIKNQKMLKDALIEFCGNYDMNVNFDIFSTDYDWAEKVRDELSMIKRCVSI